MEKAPDNYELELPGKYIIAKHYYKRQPDGNVSVSMVPFDNSIFCNGSGRPVRPENIGSAMNGLNTNCPGGCKRPVTVVRKL